MRALLRVVLGIVALVAACVLLAPASLLDAPLASRTGDRLRLADAHGLWWRGRGVVAARDGVARVPVAWRVALAPLLAGSLAVTLHAEDGTAMPTGRVAIRDGMLDIRDLHLVAPAELVSVLVPALSSAGLRGEIDARAPSFAWHGDSGSGTLEATWQPASIVAGAQPIDLGRVVLNARPAADGVAGTVRNAGGDLAIDGSLSMHAGATSVSVKLSPTASASPALRAMLSLLGPADPAGAVTLTWRSDRR